MSYFTKSRLSAWIASHLRVKSIRGQLTVGLTVTLVPCLALGFYVTQRFVLARVYSLTERRLSAEAELISYGLRQWGQGTAQVVNSLTYTPSFMAGRIDEVQSIFRSLSAENPERLWRLWSASQRPELLAFSGSMTSERENEAEQNQASREYFQAALRGYSTYQVVLSKTTGRACLNVAEPVFRSTQARHQLLKDVGSLMANNQVMDKPVLDDVSGVLVLCLPLSNLGNDTGLIDLFGDERLRLLSNDNKRDFMTDRRGFESAVILVSNSGQLLFPDVDWSSDHIPNIEELSNTSLPSLLPVARQAMRGEEVFKTVTGNGHRYLALTARVDSAWSLILLLNERTATADVAAIGHVQAFVALLTLIVTLFIIAYRSRSISRPITLAGRALDQISAGNLDVNIASIADDEVGGLLRNIQTTAERLKSYLVTVTSFAVTQKQIDTAKSIQRDFLLATLPSSPCYDVAAFSRPALDIGADWYDMVDVDDYAVFVVADVCDKGVPSALYMSVFRSLIRSKLLDRLQGLVPAAGISQVILDAIEQTNRYMAANQNSSMMFATVFIGAVDKATGTLYYVCAGHESPLLLSSGHVEALNDVGGPAIGLFAGASYSVSRMPLKPGATLVVYSDGLVDARSSSNEAWGLRRLHTMLLDLQPQSSEHLMSEIITDVDSFMSGADQFDDLTVMVFRWLGPS